MKKLSIIIAALLWAAPFVMADPCPCAGGTEPLTKTCGGGGTANACAEDDCCGDLGIAPTAGWECCGNAEFDPAVDECCDGEVVAIGTCGNPCENGMAADQGMECCGDVQFDPAVNECCDGELADIDSCIPIIDSLIATSLNGGSGVRQSSSNLVLVNSGGGVSAEIVVSASGKSLEQSYPQWSGSGVQGQNGTMAATFSGSSDSSVEVALDSNVSGSVSITVVSEMKTPVSIGTSEPWAQDLKTSFDDMVGYFSQGGTVGGLQWSGQISGERKRVDMFNDGEAYGAYYSLTGGISAGVAEMSVKGPPIPIPATPIQVRAVATFSAGSLDVSATLTNDPSKEDPWEGGGQLSYSQSISLGAEVAVGSVCGVTYTASFPTSVSGTVTGSGQKVELSVAASAGPVVGTLKAWISIIYTCEVKIAEHNLYPSAWEWTPSPFVIYENS